MTTDQLNCPVCGEPETICELSGCRHVNERIGRDDDDCIVSPKDSEESPNPSVPLGDFEIRCKSPTQCEATL